MNFKRMITAVDVHAGTPMRVITGGIVDVPGTTMLEKRKWLHQDGDDLRLLMLREAASEQLLVEHPENRLFNGVTISQLTSKTTNPKAHLKNAVTMPTGTFNWSKPETWKGAIDRCPCGTGTCAKMATMFARGQLELNQDFRYEGILNTIFTGRLIKETQVGPHRAVVPTVSGQAWITAVSNYMLDPTDPFPTGFKVGDIWS